MSNSPKSQREIAIADIESQVRRHIVEELAVAPATFSKQDLKGIEDAVMDHTALVLDALSLAEMTSEGALCTHLQNVSADTQRLIRERRPATRTIGNAQLETRR